MVCVVLTDTRLMRKESTQLRIAVLASLCWLACAASAQEPRRVTAREVRSLIGTTERVTVRGTVMFQTAPGFLFVSDDSGHVRIILVKPINLKQGDVIDVTGLPSKFADYSWLTYGSAVVVGEKPLPVPKRVSGNEVGEHDAEYVTAAGKVIGQTQHHANYTVEGKRILLTLDVLIAEADGASFKIMFHQREQALRRYPVGTIAEFTGVVRGRGEFGENENYETHVLVNDATDVKVVSMPPFWTRPEFRRQLMIGAIVVVVIALAIALWIVMQRRRMKLMLKAEEELRRANTTLEMRVMERTADLQRSLAREREVSDLRANFVTLVSHEFRTPLGVIMSASDVLQRYFDRLPPEKRARHLDMILSNTRRLATLMEEVLLLGRVEDGRMQFAPSAVDLEKLCRSLCDEIHSATKGEAHVSFEALTSLDGAVSDEALLRHIISNLLSNAVKYSNHGGPVEFTAARDGKNVVLTVRDHGIGIPEDEQEMLFTSFTRASNVGNRPGTGLGLVVVKRCVDLHNGDLKLQSKQGEGTTAIVSLPVFDVNTPQE